VSKGRNPINLLVGGCQKNVTESGVNGEDVIDAEVIEAETI
jgi:hypothetical protein